MLINKYTNVIIKNLNVCEYQATWQLMQNFTKTRNANTVDEFWFLEHEPVLTMGQAGKIEHLIVPNQIPLVKTDRGGQITYHGRGQLVCYLLIDLKRKNLSIRSLICSIEEAIINFLKDCNIHAHRVAGAPGIYVNNAKICALGLRVKNGCTYHGLSFNVNMDLVPFTYINPCGYSGLKVTQLSDLGGPNKVSDVIEPLLKHLTQSLQYN